MTHSYLYLDIETIPCQDAAKREALVADAKPPANYKKEDTIAAWREDNAADIIAKTSFDGGIGHICQISANIGDKWSHMTVTDIELESGSLAVFANFLADCETYAEMPPVIVGHNVNAFDIRFIWQRAIVLGVNLPRWFPKDPKPWGGETFDTMTAWAGQRGTVSLDNLAKYIGLEGKGGVNGSMVAQMWADGKHDEIAAYCMDDVKLVKAIHKRMMEAGL